MSLSHRRLPANSALAENTLKIAAQVCEVFWQRYTPDQPWTDGHWLAFACIDAGMHQAPDYATMRAIAAKVLAEVPDEDPDSLAEAALAIYGTTAGPDPVARAFTLAQAGPAADVADLSPRARVVLAAARLLAGWMPAGFVLPQVRIAELLGCTQRAVSAIVQRLVQVGALVVADSRWDHTTGKAKLYRLGRRGK